MSIKSSIKEYLENLKRSASHLGMVLSESGDSSRTASEPNSLQYIQEHSNESVGKVHLAIMIPSYKREDWLCDVFIENYYTMLLNPLNKALGEGHKVSLFLSVQNTNSYWEGRLIEKTDGLKGVVLEFTTIPKGTKISEIRCEMILRAASYDPSITHVMMSDDDISIVSNKRVVDHFVGLIRYKGFLSGLTVFNAKPGPLLRVRDIPTTNTFHYDKVLNLIRFQCFPLIPFLGLMESDWFDKDQLYSVNNGEDAAIITMVFVYLYSKHGLKAGFKVVEGFDEMIHLSESILKIEEIFSERYQSYLRDTGMGMPMEYHKLLKYSKCLIEKYSLKSSGFDRSTQKLNSMSYLSEIYPGLFDRWSIPTLSIKNIEKYFIYRGGK